MRLLLPALAILAVLAVAPAAEAKTRSCASADLRYPFEPGGPKTFGVFKLRVTGAPCMTAHHAAHAWMAEFEASLRGDGAARDAEHGRRVPLEASCRRTPRRPIACAAPRAKTRVTFDYVVPNG